MNPRRSPLVVKARDVGCLLLTKAKEDGHAKQIGLQKDLIKY